MNRKVRYYARWTMVVCLIAVISASPASAGWLMKKLRCKQEPRCQPVCVVAAPTCAAPCPPPTPLCCSVPAPMVFESAPIEMAPMEIISHPIQQACCCCDAGMGSVVSPQVILSEPMVVEAPFIETPMFDSVDYGTPLDAGQILGEVPMMAVPMIDDSTMSLSDQAPVATESATPIEPPADSIPAEAAVSPAMEDEAPPALPREPEVAEPKDDEPKAAEPKAAEPKAAEPKAAEPKAAEPKAAEPKPKAAEPKAAEPAGDDPFGAAPADAAPAAGDDLFGTPAAAEPAAAEPKAAAPPAGNDAAMDDLFGGGDAAPAAADPAPAAQKAPAAADPFGAPAVDPAPAGGDDPFGAPATPPATEKAPAADDGGLDDLFGGSDAAPATDAAPAKAAPAGDDPFGAPAEPPAGDKAPVKDASDALDDLFGAPGDAAPANANPAKGDGLEDLFGVVEVVDVPEESIEELPAPKSNVTVAVAANEVAANKLTVSQIIQTAVNEVIRAKAQAQATVTTKSAKQTRLQVVSVPRVVSIDPLAKTRVRTWIDNTGQFRTSGRVIEINATNVRLLKSNGRTCTVPTARMCPADSAYVKSLKGKVNDARIAMLTSK